ncbi:hypothetical protein [Leptothoe spongobia]|uniref:Uncharacterized protein n=1 Tax=Leptothoe spongobia TAU-MAC 1115 TaxID=1967444 RepID=A0A947GIJ9_9CYAN|nr:hypothetical protein [Leptothoe spongobia]MBT9316270.1 hypothetical protein [Leptothoe spongobia TAU-MAC 1115]
MSFDFGTVGLIRQALKKFFATAAQGGLADTALQPASVGTIIQGINPGIFQGRLSIHPSNPDLENPSAGQTLYLHPWGGNLAALFSGGQWTLASFDVIPLSFSGQTANRLYDVFAFLNGSDVNLEFELWTAGGDRQNPLERENGILVKNGDITRRYLGTVYYDGLLRDNAINRWVWNLYNQIGRVSEFILPGLQQHAYTGETWRIFNNDASQNTQIVSGLPLKIVANINCDVGNNGCIGLGVNFPATSQLAKFHYEQVAGVEILCSLGGSQVVSLEQGFNEFHLVQRTLTNFAEANFAADSVLQTSGISSLLQG